jgi:hypothetical protein
MNLEPKMFIEKLRMLISTCVNTNRKLFWLKKWNQSRVLREAQKFPKHEFPNATLDKWLHKVTFWH